MQQERIVGELWREERRLVFFTLLRKYLATFVCWKSWKQVGGGLVVFLSRVLTFPAER